MSAKDRKKDQSAAQGDLQAETGSIDKVRDILFGEQMRTFSDAVARLETHMEKEVAGLRSETGKRFDALEKYVKEEIAALIARIKAEQDGRSESTTAIGKDLAAVGQSLEAKIGRLEENTNDAQRDLRTQILDQSKSLQEDLQKKYDEISAILEKEAAQLRESKTDRASLAILLTELAVRLDSGLAEKLKIKAGDLSGD